MAIGSLSTKCSVQGIFDVIYDVHTAVGNNKQNWMRLEKQKK